MNLSKVKTRTWLLLILLLGFLLRIQNLTIGFPVLYASGDEATYHLSALNMLATRTPFTIGNYGPLGAYLQIPFLLIASAVLYLTGQVNSITGIAQLVANYEGYFLFIPRVISSLFGTLTVIAAYKLSKEIFRDRNAAIFGALFTALSFNLIFISHQARAWSPAIFFSYLAAYFVLVSMRRNIVSSKDFYLGCFFGALSFGFHQFGALILILILLLILSLRISFKKNLKTLSLGLFIFSFFVILFNFLSVGSAFFSLVNPTNRSDAVELFDYNFLAENFLNDTGSFVYRAILTDAAIFILAVFYWLIKFSNGVGRAYCLFFSINLVLLILFLPLFMRYMLISFAFIPIFAGAAFLDLFRKGGFNKIVASALLFTLSANIVYFSSYIWRQPTFSLAREWLAQYTSKDDPIVATTHRYLGYTPSAYAQKFARQKNENYYNQAYGFISNSTTQNVRNILYANSVAVSNDRSQYAKEAVKLTSARYVLDFYWVKGASIASESDSYQRVAYFSPVAENAQVGEAPEGLFDSTYIFPYFSIHRVGPYVDILLVKNLEN